VPELSGASRSIHPAVFTADGLCDTEYVLQVSASAVLCGEYTGVRTAAACGLTELGQGIITVSSMHAHSTYYDFETC
jgi:hypothetical protein